MTTDRPLLDHVDIKIAIMSMVDSGDAYTEARKLFIDWWHSEWPPLDDLSANLRSPIRLAPVDESGRRFDVERLLLRLPAGRIAFEGGRVLYQRTEIETTEPLPPIIMAAFVKHATRPDPEGFTFTARPFS